MALFNKRKKNEDDSQPDEQSNANAFEENSNDEIDTDEDEYYEDSEEPVSQVKRKGLYPREYPDPCDIYLNKSNQEEYYFNIEKTLNAKHLGLLWKIIPDGGKDKIEDWIWDKDFLHDIAVKQHDKSEYLNSLPASGQLAYDIKCLFIKIAAILAIIIGIWGYNFFISTPNKTFNTAITLLNDKKYAEAQSTFELLKGKKNSNIYIGLCKAQIAVDEKRFDDAAEIYEKLTPLAPTINLDNIEDLKKECTYQKAIDYYNKGEWQNAIDTVIPIIKYSNAVEYYERCQYKLADIDYENKNYYAALEKFFTIASYEDTQERMNGIMSNIYTQALEKYNSGDFIGAAEIFNSIVNYGYLDSGQMSTQCFYQSAQDAFKKGEYADAKALFEQIPQYKDSQTMVKECLYKSLSSTDYTKNIYNMLALSGYRDVNETLKTAPYNIYAEWLVSDIDGRAANNETFKFDIDGDLICAETSLPALAISNGTVKYPYTWDDEEECFITEDSNYQLYIDNYEVINYTSNDYVYITIRAVSGDKESIYRCQKIGELEEYYNATVVVNTSDTSDYELIQAYIDAMKEKEQQSSQPSASDNEPITPSQKPEDVTSQLQDDEPPEQRTKTFDCVVTKVYSDSLLVTPDPEYPESEIASRFIVLYGNSSDLEEGDIISVMYRTGINTDVEPFEIEAYKVKYLGSSNEPDNGNPADEPDENNDDNAFSESSELSDDPSVSESDNENESEEEDEGGFSF